MNSREIVVRTLEFKKPERIPIAYECCNFSDIFEAFMDYPENWKPKSRYKRFYLDFNKVNRYLINKLDKYVIKEDEWGCLWKNTELSNIGNVFYHPLKNLSEINEYNFPDPNDTSRFNNIIGSKLSNNRYNLYWLQFTLFERAYLLMGFESFLENIYLDRKNIEYLLDKILDFQLSIIEQISNLRININGIALTDDWGDQNSTFISPKIWREVFKNRYEKIINLSHKKDYHVWMHSDGKINAIIPDLIDIGLDAINLPSPNLVGIKEIGQKFGGKICFFNSVDTQTTLVKGTQKEIKEEAVSLIRNWSSEDGGLIFYDDQNYEAIGVPLAKRKKVFKILKNLLNFYNEY